MTAKIGYRTHAELMQAWDLLRLVAWEETIDCGICHASTLQGGAHHDYCLLAQAQKLLVDPPQSDPVAHTRHLELNEEVR